MLRRPHPLHKPKAIIAIELAAETGKMDGVSVHGVLLFESEAVKRKGGFEFVQKVVSTTLRLSVSFFFHHRKPYYSREF